MNRKKNTGGKKLAAKTLQIELLKFLLAYPKKQFSARQLKQLLKLENNKDSIDHGLRQLAEAGSLIEYDEGKFGVALDRLTRQEKQARKTAQKETTPSPRFKKPVARSDKGRKIIEGRVDMTRTGSAYIVSELLTTDVFVAPKYLNGALHGDTVKVLLFPPRPMRRGGQPRKPEGEVLEVLVRSRDTFIGTLKRNRNYALFIPDNPLVPMDIHIPLEACGEGRHGDKVVVKVTDWQEGKGRLPIGAVTQTLGMEGGNEFEMNKILIEAGFELSHTPEAMAEAGRIPDLIPDQEIARRRDFRDILTFTIDPEDAKDFDDALSFRVLENGHTEVGVHIADVTHYLKPDSAIDKEAYQRSTSVYLVDRVCPMLPEKLSNNLCSLVPEQDRLTFSAVFTFDEKSRIVQRWFGKTVIHSHKRFTYEEAQTVLDKAPSETLQQHPLFESLQTALFQLNKLANKMRKDREKNGAINFESEEVRFRLAEDGTPIEAYVKERKDAHLLIEDFMLLANKEVALFVDLKGKDQQEVPFVYRVHDLPDMEKLAEFSRFAAELGFPMKVDTPKQISSSFNRLMEAARSNERLKLLEPLAIRTMAKAVYSPNNIGHYGLAFTHYSHFTSPIRRYSDVLAHRILERNLDGAAFRVDKDKLEAQCKHISAQEKKAADAERESVKYKQAELMSRHLGETFDGVISGMIERGFFVELPGSKAEGMVAFRDLPEQYILDESGLRARSRYGRDFKVGDTVRVIILSVDIGRRQIELGLAED